MAVSRQSIPPWLGAAATTRVDCDGDRGAAPNKLGHGGSENAASNGGGSDAKLGLLERAISASGAALVSAVLVNPLDIAKTRLQAQAAGIPYQGICSTACFETGAALSDMKSSVSSARSAIGLNPTCHPECGQYKGTFDVIFKVARQEGFSRLWRGTYASLALAVPTVGIYLPCYDIFRNYMEDSAARNAPNLTPYVPLVAGSAARSLACVTCYPVELARTRMQAFKESHTNQKPPGVWMTLHGAIAPAKSTNFLQNVQRYRTLWTGLGAQLARDVPFSAICWSTLEPIRRTVFRVVGDEASAAQILGANFSAGFIAGSISAAVTCPLDVARTRQQIEKDPGRALRMTTRRTLVEIWRDGGTKGLFAGVSARVSRTGPSVGIVVSFYEVVKYALHRRRLANDESG